MAGYGNNYVMPYQNPQTMNPVQFPVQNAMQTYQQPVQTPYSYSNVQQPVVQPMVQEISGRFVPSAENIVPNEIPMNGGVALFPRNDLTEIYVKSWNKEGTIKTVVYKPSEDEKPISIEDKIKNEISDMFTKRFDDITSKLEELSTTISGFNKSSNNRNKKEGE